MYQSESKASFFYTALIMFLFLIPNYYAIKFSIDKQHYKDGLELSNWAKKVEDSIFTDELELPRSVEYKIGLYDLNHNLIVSNLEKEPKVFIFQVHVEYPYIYFQKNIRLNSHNVSYIIAEKQINYSIIFLISAILFLIILIIIYLFSRLMIKNTTIPYKIMQKYMNEFFDDAMHELKTPLGVININLELLDKSMSKTPVHVKRIKAATKQMRMTYEDVEYYIKNKKIKYVREKIDISFFLKERIEFFADIALSKAITIKSDIEDNLSVFMNTTEIQRVIDNTISNAIKYSSYQGILEINLIKYKDDFCKLNIKDYGQGIKDIKSIFDRFKREDEVQGGFGLGLNIVENICNKNNIEIAIKSKENSGSTFEYKISLYKIKILDKADYETK